jgi:hypothetical protein
MRKSVSRFLSGRSLRPFLLLLLLNAFFDDGASGSNLPANGDGATSSDTCKMTTTFPDQSTFAEPCLATIVLAGEDSLAPKGWIKFRDVNDRTQVFSLNFFPPKEIRVNTAYTVTTDSMDSFLNGIVQPASAHELCRMTKKFPTTGTVTFTAVGATGSQYHGTLQVYPACYLNLGTPQQALVPGGQVGGGSTMVVF